MTMSSTTITAIRLTRTPEVEKVLKVARKRYPALNDPEIFKLALSRLVHESDRDESLAELQAIASQSVGFDYLSDSEEDIYHLGTGKKVSI